MSFSLRHLLACALACLNHESIVSTLSASAWVDVLEAFELELSTGFDRSNLLADRIVGMNLCVCFSNLHRAFRLSFLLLHSSVSVLKSKLGLVSELVLHDSVYWSLRPERTTISKCFSR